MSNEPPVQKVQPDTPYLQCTVCSTLFGTIEAAFSHYMTAMCASLDSFELLQFSKEGIEFPEEEVLY